MGTGRKDFLLNLFLEPASATLLPHKSSLSKFHCIIVVQSLFSNRNSNAVTLEVAVTWWHLSRITGDCSGRYPAHRNMDDQVEESFYGAGSCSFLIFLCSPIRRPRLGAKAGFWTGTDITQGFYDPVNEKMFEPPLTGFSYSFTDDGFYEAAFYRAGSNRMFIAPPDVQSFIEKYSSKPQPRNPIVREA